MRTAAVVNFVNYGPGGELVWTNCWENLCNLTY